MMSLHISLNTAYSGCKPSTSMSSFTHSLQVFLFLPLHLTPATSTFLQANIQSSTLLSYAPDAQTTSICHASPYRPHFVCPKDCTNPHCTFYPSATLHTSISPYHIIIIIMNFISNSLTILCIYFLDQYLCTLLRLTTVIKENLLTSIIIIIIIIKSDNHLKNIFHSNILYRGIWALKYIWTKALN